jgi:hypothetical protein
MRPGLAKANAAVERASKRLAQAYHEQDKAVVSLVACRLCKAPVGKRCHKGTWPHGVDTRSHTERRTDADRA